MEYLLAKMNYYYNPKEVPNVNNQQKIDTP